MKEISLQELKRHLGRFVELARSGETIVITKHRKPVAKLTAANPRGDHIGKNFGKVSLKRLLRDGPGDGLGAEALRILQEDRDAEPWGVP